MTKLPYSKLSPEKKQKWFGEERNARRRQRYQNDEAYRAKVLSYTRKSREALQKTDKQATRPDVKAFSQTMVLHVAPAGIMATCPDVISRKDLVEALGVSNMTFSRWITSGIVPKPDLFERGVLHSYDPRYGYYPISEVTPLLDLYFGQAGRNTRRLRVLGAGLYSQMLDERTNYLRKVFK